MKIWRLKINRKKNNKKGEINIGNVIIVLVLIILTIFIAVYLFDILVIFVKYQKLNEIALKYSFIIENYGSLTNEEYEELLNDLSKKDFNINKINIILPNGNKYGELNEFVIEYYTRLNKLTLNVNNSKDIKIVVKKYFYIK